MIQASLFAAGLDEALHILVVVPEPGLPNKGRDFHV